MIVIKDEAAVKRMRTAGRVTAAVCAKVSQSIYPGVTTREIDEYAASLISEAGARSAFLGYRGYPGNICVSVNDEVVHGLPGARRVQVGDIVSLDVGVLVDGYMGDMATTVAVGVKDAGVLRLLAQTEQALQAGIRQACAGARLSDVSHAIEKVARGAGFSVVREFVGHGIGREMHEDPQIPNFGPPGRGPVLRPGMTLAIEPMLNMGRAGVDILEDGWTVVTCDHKYSAHFEHTIVIGTDGPEILTRLDD
ncbi:MAG: type I methionyl aminopeptidase [Kiritimatiellia bacterium]|nr:type I methionyl aminopeptidase [Lentisphaerota bacterium]